MTGSLARWPVWAAIAAILVVVGVLVIVIISWSGAPDAPAPGEESLVAADDLPQPAADGVPSGQPVTLQEAVFETQPGGDDWLRLRFVAPMIGGPSAPSESAVFDDMEFLCREVGLAVIARTGRTASRIILSLSEIETEFGVTYPDVTQFFEVYRPEGDTCIWEGFG